GSNWSRNHRRSCAKESGKRLKALSFSLNFNASKARFCGDKAANCFENSFISANSSNQTSWMKEWERRGCIVQINDKRHAFAPSAVPRKCFFDHLRQPANAFFY